MEEKKYLECLRMAVMRESSAKVGLKLSKNVRMNHNFQYDDFYSKQRRH